MSDRDWEKNKVKNSLEGWRRDKFLRFYDWMKVVVGVGIFFIVASAGKASAEFYYVATAPVVIFMILACINYRSKK